MVYVASASADRGGGWKLASRQTAARAGGDERICCIRCHLQERELSTEVNLADVIELEVHVSGDWARPRRAA